MKYYLIEVWGCVEILSSGPWGTWEDLERAAAMKRRKQSEDDGLHWAEVDEEGNLTVGDFSSAQVDEWLAGWRHD